MQDEIIPYWGKSDKKKMKIDDYLYGCHFESEDGKWLDVSKVRSSVDGNKFYYIYTDGIREIKGKLCKTNTNQ